MDEKELNANIKVLVDGYRYHWRDAKNRALCNMEKSGDLTPLGEEPAGCFLCNNCITAVERISKGWGN